MSVIGKSMLGTSVLGAANEVAVAKRQQKEWELRQVSRRVQEQECIEAAFKKQEGAQRERDRQLRAERAAARQAENARIAAEKQKDREAKDKARGTLAIRPRERGERER